MTILWIFLHAFLLGSLLSPTNANRKWLEENPLEKNHKQQETYNAVNDARGRHLLDRNSVGETSKVQAKSAFNLPNDEEKSNESNQPSSISGNGHDEGNDNGNTEENDPYNHYHGSTIDNHHQITIQDFQRVYYNIGFHP
ncbi:hypothetical protein AMTRI_Chr07g29420 [Amborella trichopoda]